MACRVSEEEIRAMEQSDNHVKYGLATTDAAVAVEVACMACKRLEETGRIDRAPKLVKLWWAQHKKEDEERKNNAEAAARQEEAHDRATLARLQQKYPNKRK